MELRKINPGDYEFLYELLKERRPYQNISHKELPSYFDHMDFCINHQYEAWYVITGKWTTALGNKKRLIGSVYLTKNNEIGIHLSRPFRGSGYAEQAVKELMKIHGKRRYLANIAPYNYRSKQFFVNLGFKHVQETFALE